MIPADMARTELPRILTPEKASELLKLNPTWIHFGSAFTTVFYMQHKQCGAYKAGNMHETRAVVRVLQAAGYTKYFGEACSSYDMTPLRTMLVAEATAAVQGKPRFFMSYIARTLEYSERVVRDWRILPSGKHLVGYCELAKGERTFLMNGIVSVVAMPQWAEEDVHMHIADVHERLSKARAERASLVEIQALEQELRRLKEVRDSSKA
jgi:hypothetical protein